MRSARTSSLVQHIQKVARKYALGSICAHLDDKSHRLHEVRGFFKPLTLTKIVEDLKGKFPWITFNIIYKAYRKHTHGFVEA